MTSNGKHFTSFGEIIHQWPTYTELADDLGIRYVTAQKMGDRGNIHPRHWKRLIKAARARKIVGVTANLLVDIADGA